MVEVELKSWGNSIGVILPIEALRELGLKRGDRVDIRIIDKKRVDGFGACKGGRPFAEDRDLHKDLW
ncbi:MAG: AbrB/MazE/SpoVT family DNA-binding domain-containing protein [Nanoarchaeota archaeon]